MYVHLWVCPGNGQFQGQSGALVMICPGNEGFRGQMNVMFRDNFYSRDDHEIYSIMSGRNCYKCLKNSGECLVDWKNRVIFAAQN